MGREEREREREREREGARHGEGEWEEGLLAHADVIYFRIGSSWNVTVGANSPAVSVYLHTHTCSNQSSALPLTPWVVDLIVIHYIEEKLYQSNNTLK